jgi:hypothetical protein
MRAYHNDPDLKASVLAGLAAHRAADELAGLCFCGCGTKTTIAKQNHVKHGSRACP